MLAILVRGRCTASTFEGGPLLACLERMRLDVKTLTRRELLERAASAAAIVVVSQPFLACAAATAAGVDSTGTAAGTTTASPTCVLTAALTEGPYFVDEKLNRSDIRTDPSSGAVSGG